MFSEYQWFSPDTKGPDGKDTASRKAHVQLSEQQDGDNTLRGNQSGVDNPPGGRDPGHDADRFKAVPGISGNTQAETAPQVNRQRMKDAPQDQG